MREIKFRAIIKSRFPELNKMCYGTGIFEDGVNTWLLEHDPTKCMADNLTHRIIDKNTIGQYTGLKDKNGKEIYEWDIVEVRIDGMGTGREFPVVWDSDDLTYKVGAAMLGGMDVEVIGNIYENPELVK